MHSLTVSAIPLAAADTSSRVAAAAADLAAMAFRISSLISSLLAQSRAVFPFLKQKKYRLENIFNTIYKKNN
jgi:hypothetical protein